MPHVSEQHAQHDHLLVVSLAAGDLAGTERDRATSLIAHCPDCASLHEDLLAIARATAALPAVARARDFRISPEQAARLRPAGWRRFVGAFPAPQFALSRQLGIGLTTIGLAGLLVSTIPSIQLGAGSAAASPAAMPAAASAAPGEAASNGDSLAGSPSVMPPVGVSQDRSVFGAAGSPAPSAGTSYEVNAAGQPSASSGRSSSSGGAVALRPAASPSGKSVTEAPEAPNLLSASGSEDRGLPLSVVVSSILIAAGLLLLIARRLAARFAAS
jgi:hypothetical protein